MFNQQPSTTRGLHKLRVMKSLKIDTELLQLKMFTAEQKLLLALLLEHEDMIAKCLGSECKYPFKSTAKEISQIIGLNYNDSKDLFTSLSENGWIKTKKHPEFWARETWLTPKFYNTIGRV